MWVVRLSDKQLEVVRAVLRSEEHRGRRSRERSRRSTWPAGTTSPRPSCPGARWRRRPSKQGVSEADVIWDRCGRHEEPAVPPIRAKRRVQAQGQGRPPGKRAA